MWLGNGKDGKITIRNTEGLMIEIIGEKDVYSHVLLSGDVPYACIPDLVMQRTINFMHVPHHCSNMNLDKLKNLPNQGLCAIISTNRKADGLLNYDGHHYQELLKKFTVVINTMCNTIRNDEANLSVQLNYRYKYFCFR